MSHPLVLLCSALVIIVGCSVGVDPTGPSQDAPSRAPSIRGTITAVREQRIRVEQDPSSQGGAKADVRISQDTQLRDREGRAIQQSALAVGAEVRVWFAGPVAESFPVQATAAFVVLDKP
jgi:hypothetical protein